MGEGYEREGERDWMYEGEIKRGDEDEERLREGGMGGGQKGGEEGGGEGKDAPSCF